MTNVELMEGFSGTESKDETLDRIAMADKKRKEDLRKYKPIKDLLKGREKEWDGTKEIVKTWIYENLMVGNEVVTRDFLAGIKFFTEIVDERLRVYDESFYNLGKE